MADVISKETYSKIHEWESSTNSLAPLSSFQRNAILDLSDEISQLLLHEGEDKLSDDSGQNRWPDEEPHLLKGVETSIESTNQFLQWYSNLENDWLEDEDSIYTNYCKQLAERKEECSQLLSQVESSLSNLNELNREYRQVTNRTNSLHQVSEQLLADQMKLSDINNAVSERLDQFKVLRLITQRLESPALSVNSSTFTQLLDQLDGAIQYMQSHPNFKESSVYLARYQHCLARAVSLLRSFVTSVLIHATQQTAAYPTSDASHYARFQAQAIKLKPVLELIEKRRDKFSEYENLLSDCQQLYLSQRETLISDSVLNTIRGLAENMSGDHCSLTRSACAFLIHVSQDELRLYQQFFSTSTPLFTQYLEGLCVSLYDTLRPLVIHMKHLETLAEQCSILRNEMIQEQVQNNPTALEAFGKVAEQLLQDVQERLVFRAHLYLKSDIAEYNPSPGDLAYPEKLEMMESIAQSLHDQEMAALSRSESRASLVSIGSTTSQEVSRLTTTHRNFPASSPGDLHGMWYPPVRRTLVCLSRLYRCIERPIFQGLSQEALTLCIQSINSAAETIKTNKTALDGELFQIKHLLILREQIAPFQVDFTVKEMSFDFSKMRTAAYELLQKRSRVFSSNALLQFLLEGPPIVKEQWLDSRKDVDRQLKSSCEVFIADAANTIIGPLSSFLDRVQSLKETEGLLRAQPWAGSDEIHTLVQDVTRNIKTKLPTLQRSMQLYLANRDTEFILYRPIKNNIVGTLSRLQNILSNNNGYTNEDRIMIACPTPEQVAVLLSSASLLMNEQRKISQVSLPPTINKTVRED
ncbi:conserved oligomeric Golgi complex subunit 3 [Macrosteles quadrilineatus]|uniref:conserved oligomeric Golgi complex subunit 3 n=1 Tax=Macrosteles quadrilineatus TaxID=74068 RepID=UPI0023E0E1F4|nr:conserved oligomeric Golgi complex subunit 3 [Macrosteles quadrilineatus]